MKVTSIYTTDADYKQHTGKMKITVIIIINPKSLAAWSVHSRSAKQAKMSDLAAGQDINMKNNA